MNKKSGRSFAKSLISLELQVKTLLEEAGGAECIKLLDTLSALNRSEQKMLCTVFQKATEKVLDGENRIETAQDRDLNQFEESLYQDILSEMNRAADAPTPLPSKIRKSRKLSVVPKSEGAKTAAPIDLETARRNRAPKGKFVH